jgi:hypothetical protein
MWSYHHGFRIPLNLIAAQIQIGHCLAFSQFFPCKQGFQSVEAASMSMERSIPRDRHIWKQGFGVRKGLDSMNVFVCIDGQVRSYPHGESSMNEHDFRLSYQKHPNNLI